MDLRLKPKFFLVKLAPAGFAAGERGSEEEEVKPDRPTIYRPTAAAHMPHLHASFARSPLLPFHSAHHHCSFLVSLSLDSLSESVRRPLFPLVHHSLAPSHLFTYTETETDGGVQVIFGASCVSSLNMHAFRGHASSEPFAAPGPTTVEPFLFHPHISRRNKRCCE